MALSVWLRHIQPPTALRDAGVAVAGLVLPTLMAFLYAAWNDPAKRPATCSGRWSKAVRGGWTTGRISDPIGGPVAGALSRAGGDPVDHGLLDPEERYYLYGQAPPSPQGHSGYWADPRVWNLINQVATAGIYQTLSRTNSSAARY